MKTVRRYAVAVCLVLAVATGSALAAPRDDDGRSREVVKTSKIRAFIKHLLDVLDSKISVPPT